MLSGNDPFIFISYAREDQDLVDREVRYIEGLGYEVWIDKRQITAGSMWDEVIRDAIDRFACFVVFLTRISANSKNVKKEIELALKLRKPFIAVFCENVTLSPKLHGEVRKMQGLEQYLLPRKTFEEQLSSSLRNIGLTIPDRHNENDNDAKAWDYNSSDKVQGISPKVIVFALNLLGIFFLFFGIVAIVIPFFSGQTPGDPLNNRLAGFLTGGLLIAVAGALRAAAFIMNRAYLRRGNA